MTNGAVQIRSAGAVDGVGVSTVFTAARAAMLAYLPALHTPEEDIAYFSGVVAARDQPGHVVDVAEAEGSVVAFSALRHEWLDHLYVHPDWQGRGIGTQLLARAQGARPEGLCLWVFEQNSGALALYGRAGFVEIERTDGSHNEERVPDVKMRWPGTAAP